MKVFGIDIGGSGVKGAPVDLTKGNLAVARYRRPTPQPSTPGAVLDVAAKVVAHFGWQGTIGCTVPGVVRQGIVFTAANIDPSWVGTDAEAGLRDRTGCRVHVLNDADAAGLAEASFGAAKGERGTVLLLTFGTGIGSAIIVDGRLVPNTELGHLEFHGEHAETYAAARLVERNEMSVDWWVGRVNEYLAHVEFLFSPDLIVFGGGISKRFEEFSGKLHTRARLAPAAFRNNAGIVGAALAAHNRFKEG